MGSHEILLLFAMFERVSSRNGFDRALMRLPVRLLVIPNLLEKLICKTKLMNVNAAYRNFAARVYRHSRKKQ